LTGTKNYFSEGFAVVIVVLDTDARCRKSTHDGPNHQPASKSRNVKLSLEIKRSPWDDGAESKLKEWFLPFLLIILFVGGFVAAIICSWLPRVNDFLVSILTYSRFDSRIPPPVEPVENRYTLE